MLTYKTVKTKVPDTISCDRCPRTDSVKGMEGQEFLRFSMGAGFGSVFGDGNLVSLDLCQHCVKEVLGEWLRVEGT